MGRKGKRASQGKGMACMVRQPWWGLEPKGWTLQAAEAKVLVEQGML